MKTVYENFQSHTNRRISICDAQINTIVCTENVVQFHFFEGFWLIDNNQVSPTKAGYIELVDCNADEFNCHLIRRKATPKGAKLYGLPLSLNELNNLLTQKNRKIEINMELYDFNSLHWRGTLLPYKKRGLSDYVIIETTGCFPITYSWY